MNHRLLKGKTEKVHLCYMIRPVCNADHDFGTVTLCLQKISKFVAKTNVQKANISLKSQDSVEQSGPDGPLVLYFVTFRTGVVPQKSLVLHKFFQS